MDSLDFFNGLAAFYRLAVSMPNAFVFRGLI